MRPGRYDSWSEAQVNVAPGRRTALLAASLLVSLCPGNAYSGTRAAHELRRPADRPLRDDASDGPEVGNQAARLYHFINGLLHGSSGRHAEASPDDVTDGMQKAVDAAKTAAKVAGETLQKASDTVKKPLMAKIDAMRSQLCWKRADLWTHKDCLKFLGLKCKDKSTGTGVCTKFRVGVKEHCEDDAAPKKAQEGFCKLAKFMKIPIDESAPAPAPAPAPEEEIVEEGEAKPEKANETKNDMDGDGIPDDEDPDKDGDGHENEKDAFPEDPKEHSDLDGDGIGDNSDEDRDGDGVPNDEDSHPDDPTKAHDRDGDGVVDSEDAFPDDPKETSDMDGDGIGDNSDPDRDGDGVPNDKDSDPDDPETSAHDSDGDGIEDEKDAFPDDPKEWLDSDGDGVGDNADIAPHDAACWKNPCKTATGEPMVVHNEYNKDASGHLPSQGYDEHSDSHVQHKDGHTGTADWGAEWPQSADTQHKFIKRICADHPDNAWCKRYRKRRRKH